jgi:hypothetical protein
MTLRRLKYILKGYAKSLTARTGELLFAAGYLQTQGDTLQKWFGQNAAGNVMMVLGLVVGLLRLRTTQSLADKGAPK